VFGSLQWVQANEDHRRRSLTGFTLPCVPPHPILSGSFSRSACCISASRHLLPRCTHSDGTSAASSQKMVCQETCLQYSASETSIVNNTEYCPGPDTTNGNRSTQLVKDFTDCTNWTTLATKNSTTCVMGMTNEGNCGFGSSTTEVCSFCSNSSPDPCCYQCRRLLLAERVMLIRAATTDVSVCGYVLASQTTSGGPSSTGSSPSSTASGSLQNANSASHTALHGGKLVGTIVGSVIGGLFVSFLLLLIIMD